MRGWVHRHKGAFQVNNFALLWGKILDSSIWVKESKETRLVWITLLAMKDQVGQVHASVIGLADRAKVSLDECKSALSIFLNPDPDDTSGVEGGRRIRNIPGGWEIINHDLYRFSTDSKREFWRQQKAEYRARQKKPKPSHNGSSAAYEAALNAGASQEQLDAIVTDKLPKKSLEETVWEEPEQ